LELSQKPNEDGFRIPWIVIIIVGGLSEEVWRAFTIVELHKSALSFFAGAVLTALCFAAGQLGGKPSRISGIPAEVHFTTFVGFVLGSAFVMSRIVAIGVAANVVYYLLVWYMIRKNRPEQTEPTSA
jgi:membrane protease YdiL (CAAX protease family)